MEIGKWQGFQEPVAILEFIIGLAREAGDDIGADTDGGEGGIELLHYRAEVSGGVVAVHGLEHPVVAALQRDMQMGTYCS